MFDPELTVVSTSQTVSAIESIVPRYIPPHNIDAEQSVLGAVMFDNEAMFELSGVLQPDDFYREAHQTIFKAMENLSRRSAPIDTVTLAEQLRAQQTIDQVGGTAYLIALFDAVPTASNVLNYAKIVADKAHLRRYIESGVKLIENATAADAEVDKVAAQHDAAVMKMADMDTVQADHIYDVYKQSYDYAENVNSRHRDKPGMSTGLTALDAAIGGMEGGDLVIVAARPSMGKTVTGLQIALNMAAIEKKPGLFVSIEMPKRQIARRIITTRTGIPLQVLRSGNLMENDWDVFSQDTERVIDLPFYLLASSSERPIPVSSLQYIKRVVRKMSRTCGIGAVFIDHLGKIRTGKRFDRRDLEVGYITQELKEIANDYDIPVVLLCQINRANEKRQDARPMLSDLRESGEIEQDADIVIGLYRESYYTKQPSINDYDPMEMIVLKNRNGQRTTVTAAFYGDTQTIGNMPDEFGMTGF